ncbi:MAG: HAD family hydrolase [Actinomycetota bacterium]
MADSPRFDPTTVAAVVFDIGGVFTYPQYQPVHELLPSIGVGRPADIAVYREAHHRGVRALTEAVLGPERLVPDEGSQSVWAHYDDAYAGHLGVAASLRERVRVAMRSAWDWVHVENVAAFHRLAGTGMPTAIVSNNDGTAAEQMRDHGVCQVGPGSLPSVAALVDSGVAGVAKPDPAIFAPALDALGQDPATVLYVGDTVHADVHGATRAGMQVVQLDPYDDHAAFDHARLRDLDELNTVLRR